MDRRTLEEIGSLLEQIDELRRRLDQLLASSNLPGITDEIRGALGRIRHEAERQAAQEFQHALARVNFEDKDYRLIRVIDGDTLEVRPPEGLQRWMRDVHIRLYGVDAPERNSELGPIYTEILDRLCRMNGGRLRVVWERERQGNEYAGFPTYSFERGVGNVFVDIDDRFMLYVNGVLASLPDVQIVRGRNRLIRVSRHVREWPHLFWHYRHEHPPFHPFWPWGPYSTRRLLGAIKAGSPEDLRQMFLPTRRHHPWLVWCVPKGVLLDPNPDREAFHRLVFECAEDIACPECRETVHALVEQLPRLLEDEDATSFDLLLLLAYAWGHKPEIEARAE